MDHGAITKTYSGCRKCQFVGTCNHKLMELQSYVIPSANNHSALSVNTIDVSLDMIRAAKGLGERLEREISDQLGIKRKYFNQ